MRASSLSKFGLAALCSALLTSCAQSPTGRSQMLLFSPQQMNQLGADSFEQMKKQEKVSKDARVNAYVSCVARAVTAQVPASYGITSWEVVVFDSKEVNAFALPGGKIGVYSGLLKVAKNQDQLATVIGLGTATIGSTVAAKGLGEVIIAGLLTSNLAFIVQGGVITGVLAVLISDGFQAVARHAARKSGTRPQTET